MLEKNSISNDLSKVFIPCRTVLEMEALTSLFLATSNYDLINEVPESRPSSERLINIFGVLGNAPHERIIDFFINVAVEKLKPIVMYARQHHDRYRMGNVTPYTKTRNCLFFALHRLKIKFLIINSFLEDLKLNKKYEIDEYFDQDDKQKKTIISALYKYYIEKNKLNLEAMLPKEGVSERVKGLIDRKDSITNEKLLEMATYTFYSEDDNIVRYIMREIKAILFVCKLMFAKMDVDNPFLLVKETMINAEEIMISNDFIPELLPAMSINFSENNFVQLLDCFKAFDFMIKRVFKGINNAIETTSGRQLKLGLNDTLYNTGNIY